MHLLLGVVATAQKDEGSARAAFRKALRLDPTLTLPPSAGPHIESSIEEARAALAVSAPLSVSVDLNQGASKLLIKVRVSGNDDGLAARFILRGPGVNDTHTLSEPGLEFSRDVPVTKTCATYTAAASDQFGNELWPMLASATVCPEPARTADGARPPVKRAPEVKAKPPATKSASVPALVWISGAAATGFAVATGVLGVEALSKRSDFRRKNEDATVSVETRRDARNTALTFEHLTTLSAALTAIAAVPAAFYLATSHDESPRLSAKVGLASFVVDASF
jgi:hypothetical protein